MGTDVLCSLEDVSVILREKRFSVLAIKTSFPGGKVESVTYHVSLQQL